MVKICYVKIDVKAYCFFITRNTLKRDIDIGHVRQSVRPSSAAFVSKPFHRDTDFLVFLAQ